jgi:FtsH-binding integral membrane protein
VDDEQGPPEPDRPAQQMPPAVDPTIPPPPGQPTQVVYHVTQPAMSNGLATAALVCGIVGVVLFFTIWVGLILGVLAIVFGAVGRSRAGQGAPNKGQATAGLWLGIVAVAVSLIFMIVLASWVTTVSGDRFPEIVRCIDDPDMC